MPPFFFEAELQKLCPFGSKGDVFVFVFFRMVVVGKSEVGFFEMVSKAFRMETFQEGK